MRDLRDAGVLHRVDLLHTGVPQHTRQVHGGRSDLRHPGLELRPAGLHLPAQVLRPACQTREQHRGADEASP